MCGGHLVQMNIDATAYVGTITNDKLNNGNDIPYTIYDVNIQNLDKYMKKNVIFVIDNSAAMPEGILDSCIKGINCMLKSRSAQINVDFVFTFAEGTSSIQCGGIEEAERKISAISRCNTSNDTNVCFALDCIENYMAGLHVGVITIVFVLAGNETVRPIHDIVESLRRIYALASRSVVEMYTIGVGETHDAYLMAKLMCIGNSLGSYRYVKNESEMTHTMNALAVELQSIPLCASIRNSAGKMFSVELRETIDARGVFQGFLFGEFDTDGMTLRIDTGRGSKTIGGPDIKVVSAETCGPKFPMMYTRIQLLHIRMRSLLRYISLHLDAEGIQNVETSISLWESELTEIVNGVCMLVPVYRKQIVGVTRILRTIVMNYRLMLDAVKAKKQSVDLYARLHQCLYMYNWNTLITSTYGIKQMNAFINKYVTHVDKVASLVHEMGNDVDISKDLDAVVVDQKNWRDLLRIGDCLCIYLSNDEKLFKFTSAEDYMLQKSLGNTNITYNIMPLWICGTCWELASVKITELYPSYSTARDVLLDMFSNCVENMFMEQPADGVVLYYKLLLSTLSQMMRDMSLRDLSYLENLINTVNVYALPGSPVRVNIPNNRLFAAEVFAGLNSGIVPKFKTTEHALDFFMVMREEEIRRTFPHKYTMMSNVEARNFVINALGLKPHYYENYISRYIACKKKMIETAGSSNMSKYAQFAISQLKSAGVKIDASGTVVKKNAGKGIGKNTGKNTNKNSDKSKTNGSSSESGNDPSVAPVDLDPLAPGLYADLPNIDRDVYGDGIYKIINECLKCPSDDDRAFFDTMVNTPLFIRGYVKLCTNSTMVKEPRNVINDICMQLQNILQRTKHLRISAINANGLGLTPVVSSYVQNYVEGTTPCTYIDFVSKGGHERALIWLRGLYGEICRDKIKAGRKEYDDSLNVRADTTSQDIRTLAGLFAASNDIYEAIGIVYGSKHGLCLCAYADALVSCGQCDTCKGVVGCELNTNKYNKCMADPTTNSVVIPLLEEKIKLLVTGKYMNAVVIDDIEKFASKSDGVWKPSRSYVYRLYRRNKSTRAYDSSEFWTKLFPQYTGKIKAWYENASKVKSLNNSTKN